MKTLLNAIRTPKLRGRILFTLAMLVVYRIGSFLPTPGVDYKAVSSCLSKMGTGSEDFVGYMNMFSGGAMLQLSVFALGVTPYITASIVIQLLKIVIPRFMELHKEGQSGEAKLTEYTRYLTIGLAVVQSAVIVLTAKNGALFNGRCGSVLKYDSPALLAVMVLVMTGGTGLVMWMAELVTEKGVGQGMSVLIFMSICSGFLPKIWSIGADDGNWVAFSVVVATLLAVFLIVDYVELCQRRVPVQYTKHAPGTALGSSRKTYMPLKINMSGVMPPIFASSILVIPTLAAQFMDPQNPVVKWISANLTSSTNPWYVGLYSILLVFFCFYYSSVQFDPVETVDNMKQSGGFIPGVTMGSPTVKYLQYLMDRLNSVGAVYLLAVAMVPTVLAATLGVGASLPFGGTTVLIIANVGLETLRQVKAQAEQWEYSGVLPAAEQAAGVDFKAILEKESRD